MSKVPLAAEPLLISNLFPPVCVEEMENVEVAPAMWRVLEGQAVPMPKRKFVLSQNRFALFCEKIPPVPTNGMEPEVSPVKASVVPVAFVKVMPVVEAEPRIAVPFTVTPPTNVDVAVMESTPVPEL